MGQSKTYRRISDAGRWIDRHFCPTCGDTVFWYVEFAQEEIGIAIGYFENPQSLTPASSYWNRSKHPWVKVPPEWQQYETE